MTKYFTFVPLVCGFPGLADRPLPGRTPPPRTPLNSKSWIVCCRVEWKKNDDLCLPRCIYLCNTYLYFSIYVGIVVVNEKTGIGLLLNMHLSGEKKMGDSYCIQVSYIIYNFLSIDDIKSVIYIMVCNGYRTEKTSSSALGGIWRVSNRCHFSLMMMTRKTDLILGQWSSKLLLANDLWR